MKKKTGATVYHLSGLEIKTQSNNFFKVYYTYNII